jgi:Tol biopolymer transport system component
MFALPTLLRAQAVTAPRESARPASQQPLTRRISFTTREGSWLSFDVSPDRSWIVFDLLGQLWRMPTSGGKAEPLTDVVRDSAEFIDPRIAPDGQSVLAHGEYRGRIGVFVVDVKSRGVRWLAPDTIRATFGHFAVHSPSWTSQTTLFYSRVAPQNSDALIERDVRTGVEHTVRVDSVPEPGRDAPSITADGTWVFFNSVRPFDARLTFPGAGRIWRVPRAGGHAEAVSPPALRARGATPSPDGVHLVYFVLDSASRAQLWLQRVGDTTATPLTNDADVTPTRVHWLTADTILYIESGRMWKLAVASRRRTEIPFEVTVAFNRRTPALPPVRFPAPGDRVAARTAKGFALSQDGARMAVLLGTRLWVSSTLAGSTAHVVATVPATAAAPHWSPDGRHVVWFAGPFNEENLFVTDVSTGRTSQLTALPGVEIAPMWSPDGRHVLFRHIGPDSTGRAASSLRVVAVQDTAVRALSATTSLGMVGSPADGKPRWSPDGRNVLVLGPAGNRDERPASIRSADGSATRAVRGLPPGASSIQWVAGDTLLFLADQRLMTAHLDVVRGLVSNVGVLAHDAATVIESSYRGDVLYQSEDGFRVRTTHARTHAPIRVGAPVRYVVPAAPSLLVRNVRIIDGNGAPATTPKDILMRGGRIVRIAPAGSLRAAPSVQVLDAAGRTAMPGLIDLHSHHLRPSHLRGLLYYGVTTLRNVGCDAPPADAVAMGDWPGPRIAAAYVMLDTESPFSSGGCAGTLWEADAAQLPRASRLITGSGASLVKVHSNTGWAQQMRIVAGAHMQGTRVTGHCAYPLALMAAGIDTKEHLGWQCTMHDVGTWYDDLVQLYRETAVPIVPTLALFLTSDRQRGTRVPAPDEVASVFSALEQTQMAGSLNFRSQTAANTMDLRHAMDAAGKLHRAGVVLGAGTDFERPDGLQYELEALVEAGLTPLAAIRAATSDAARIMGAHADIGRVALGLFGDLVIVEGDPSTDIRNARRVWQVVQAGRLVDRAALRTPSP